VALEGFTIHDGCAYVRPTGKVGWPSIVSLLLQAMAECQTAGVAKLVVDISLTTQERLDEVGRFEVATAVAEGWDRSIKFAVVARPDQADKNRFAEVVARNRGLVFKAALSEEEALTWLRSLPG
jgi:hypothetical protein